jgi:hypothetical protein
MASDAERCYSGRAHAGCNPVDCQLAILFADAEILEVSPIRTCHTRSATSAGRFQRDEPSTSSHSPPSGVDIKFHTWRTLGQARSLAREEPARRSR